mgnify:CR=1 FL=1
MYSVSNDYLTAIGKNARAHKLVGTVNGTSFDGDDVIKGSFQIRNQLCPATEIILGGVYVGELKLTFTEAFASSMNIRGSWKGKIITASIGVELADASFEYIPINGGSYIVETAQWTDAGIQIVAYDYMSLFDKSLPATTIGGGTLYDLLSLVCTACGVTLGLSQAECSALPNGTETFYAYPENAMVTYRDMISEIAEACCCFATINRSGELILKTLPAYNSVTLTIPYNLRYSTSFSDFTSYYSRIKVTSPSDGAVNVYENHSLYVEGLSLDVGNNPYLETGLAVTYTRMRQAIVDALQTFISIPFSATLLPNPALDLGDLIEFTGGIGQGYLSCVMSLVHKLDSTTIEGYGENPRAAGATSTLSKQVTTQSKSTKNEMVCHTFVNSHAFSLGDSDPTTIIEINFSTVSPKTVKILHEIMLNVTIADTSGIATCTAYYYVNDVLEAYEPIDSWNSDGYHLLHLLYFLENLLSGSAYEWRVVLEMNGGTATIAQRGIHALLEGQGLVAGSSWNGTLECEDTYTPLVLGHDLTTITDTVTALGTQTPQSVTVTDIVGTITLGHDIGTITELVDIDLTAITTNLIAENGDNLIIEAGNNLVTEGT